LWAVIIGMILAAHGIGVCLIGFNHSAPDALTMQDIRSLIAFASSMAAHADAARADC
jgi:hypothetical protein